MKEVRIRKSNFELMRITSMILIILWHVILHGKLLDSSAGAFNIYYKFILYFAIIHVNSFVILMGYFQSKSKFKLSKLLSLMIEVVFYSFLILSFASLFKITDKTNIMNFIDCLLPSAFGNYWFICCYVIVYIFSDYINKFIGNLSKKEFKKLLLIMFFVLSIYVWISGMKILENTGYSFYHFIFMYMIGAYLRLYPLKESYHFKKMSITGYKTFLFIGIFVIVLINVSLNVFAHDVAYSSDLLYDIAYRILSLEYYYSAPLIIIQTILYFEIFRYINIKSKIINYVSSCTFGIYLLHDNIIIRKWLYHFLRLDVGYFGYKKFLYAFICVLNIFLIGLIVESTRKLIFFLLNKLKLVKKMKDKVRRYFTSLNLEINW